MTQVPRRGQRKHGRIANGHLPDKPSGGLQDPPGDAPPPGWPWPQPRSREDDDLHAAVAAHESYHALKKRWGGLAWRYGRHGQFLFRWEDVRLADGRFACRNCGTPVSGRRRFLCTEACSRAWTRRHVSPTKWTHWRRKAMQRDGDRCTLCGDGPMSPADVADEREISRLEGERHQAYFGDGPHHHDTALWKQYEARLEPLRRRVSLRVLEVDHVLPVHTHPHLEYDLDNLRTLCRACHARHGWRPGRRLKERPADRTLEAYP